MQTVYQHTQIPTYLYLYDIYRLAQKLRETHACVVIQSKWKAYQERKRYLRVYTAIVLIQVSPAPSHALTAL